MKNFAEIWLNLASQKKLAWQLIPLLPLSWSYGAIFELKSFLYKHEIIKVRKLDIPVICIGNIIIGGAGKTPTTIEIVNHLKSRGFIPAVVSRGYGRASNDCREVHINDNPQDTGDEPLLIRKKCNIPVFVAPQRYIAAKALLSKYPACNVIVCDDAMQHLPLKKDITICVFDERLTGNNQLIPAGILRQKFKKENLADLILQTSWENIKNPIANSYNAARSLENYAVNKHGEKIEIHRLKNEKIYAIAAIARPHVFFKMLENLNLNIYKIKSLPDHFDYKSDDKFLKEIQSIDKDIKIICTEKDAEKLWQICPQALYIPLKMEIEAGFFKELNLKLDNIIKKD